jgi:hypothetical protein
MSTPESIEMTARIQRLERSHQRLHGLVVLLVLAAFVQTAWHYLPAAGALTTRRLLIQQSGRPARAELSIWDDGTPALRFNDDSGQARALLALRRDGTLSLHMNDDRFVTRLEMLVRSDGQPRVMLCGADGRSRAEVWIDAQGHGRFDAPAR